MWGFLDRGGEDGGIYRRDYEDGGVGSIYDRMFEFRNRVRIGF